MTDPRDGFFTKIHAQWLKPLGYRKRGRRSDTRTAEDLILSVILESGASYPRGPTRFGFDLRATHLSLPKNQVLINIGLSDFAEGVQRWSYEYGESTGELFGRIESIFSTSGIDLLQRMSTLAGIADLHQQLDAVQYFDARAWCLDKLGRFQEAQAVVEQAIERAPNENFWKYAKKVLTHRNADSGA